MNLAGSERAQREKAAYDDGGHFKKKNRRLHNLFGHVRRAPNSKRGFETFERKIFESSGSKSVLEIGCGRGALCQKVFDRGAADVLGIDISDEMLKRAVKLAQDGLRFTSHDVHKTLDGQFDVIFGQAILHHLDYRKILPRLYSENLCPGGKMYFMEPLGQNIILRLYWKFGTEFHTPDERPFMKSDLGWLNEEFSKVSISPVNYATIPVGALSSLIFRSPDNALTRLADNADCFIERNLPGLHHRFRSAIFTIEKPI